MRFKLLFIFAFILASAQAWAASDGNSQRGGFFTSVIAADIEALDFGDVEVGYPVSKSFVVTGHDLVDDINLRIETHSVNYYKVTPENITPEQAENGVTVKVTYSPSSWWWSDADLILTSQDAVDIDIPITANPYYPDLFLNNQEEQFSAFVGQMDTRTGVVRFADYEVPTDPTLVDRAAVVDGIIFDGYSFTVEGDTNADFFVRIVKASSLANLCTVAISYIPHSCGTHEATLKVFCSNAGVPLVTIPLKGEATKVLGDLDGDGLVGVGDVTDMIDTLLRGDVGPEQGDMNGDGKFTIGDVSMLIDRMLEVQ